MIRSTRVRVVLLSALAAGLAACGADSPTAPFPVADAALAGYMAGDAANAVGSQLALFSDEGTSGKAVYPASVSDPRMLTPLAITVTCTGPDASGWTTCNGTNNTAPNNLTFKRAFRFLDANNAPLPAYSTSVAAIEHTSQLGGTIVPTATTATDTIWVNRADTAKVAINRASSPEQHTWNASGHRSDSMRVVDGTATRRWKTDATTKVQNLAFNMPRTTYKYPIGGTITHDMNTTFSAVDGTQTFTKSVAKSVVVTFNGTNTATMQVGALTCSLNLDTRAVSNCH